MPYKDKERRRLYHKEYYQNHETKIKNNWKIYYCGHINERKKNWKKWYLENKEKRKEYDRKYREKHKGEKEEYQKQYRFEHREYKKQYYQKKYKNNLKYRINCGMRRSMKKSLKDNINGGKWENLVNYTSNDLLKHLKSTIPGKYIWQDYLKGRLHIDHIIPQRAFIFKTSRDKDFEKCWSLYNLRLLPAKENLIKKDNITNPVLLGLLIREVKNE